MIAITQPAVGLLIAAACLAAFARESLRNPSRSRLDEACRRLRRHDRMNSILSRLTEAFLVADLLSAVLVGILAALAGMRYAADLAALLDASGRIAVWTEPFVLAAGFVLAFYLLPWCFARVAGERFVALAWPAIDLLIRLSAAYVALARRLDRFLHRAFGLQDPSSDRATRITEEIRTAVELGHREGVLAPHARRMIERVITLQEDDVAAIMTPRTEMDCVPGDVSLDEARRLMLEGGHSRMPVIGASIDDIVGILYAKDLLRYLSSSDGRALQLKDVVREPFYIPETTGIDKLLDRMKRRGVHIAIVVDEYSGIAGLVTMEDILERIVGDIVDEYDTAVDTGIKQVGAGTIEVEPWVRIDDLRDQFGLDFPEDEDYDTIGGFVYAQLGRIPRKREILTWKQIRLTVLDADKRRIYKIRIDSLSPAPLRLAEQR